jgi:uncharacterized metal-binding protein
VLTAVAVAACTVVAGADKAIAVFATLGCTSGVLLSPDLDVDAGYIGIGIAKKYLGSIFSTGWKFAWKPYAIIVPHRSRISHMPGVGTVLRLLYVYAFYLVIGTFLFYTIGWPRTVYILPVKDAITALLHGTAQIEVKAALAGFLGLCLVDTLHALMDVASTAMKKFKFRRRKAWQFTLSDVGNAMRKW